MTLKRIVSSLGIGAGAVMIGLGLQYALAQTSGSWTAAPSSPPSNNVPAPINVGSADQAKAGWLSLGTTSTSAAFGPLDVEGVGYIKGLILGQNNGSPLQILDGNQTAGAVLTSDANGNASWAMPAGRGTNSVPFIGAGTYSWTAPAGVTSVQVQAWGAGGAGDWNISGGGSGGYVVGTVQVTPGTTYNIVVGAGGTRGTNSNSSAGGNSSFLTVVANGGQPGYYSSGTGGGGSGGTVTTGNPGTKCPTAGAVCPGGSAPQGGVGGLTATNSYYYGIAPGGGGASNANAGQESNQAVNEGNGADGEVILTFAGNPSVYSCPISTSSGSQQLLTTVNGTGCTRVGSLGQ